MSPSTQAPSASSNMSSWLSSLELSKTREPDKPCPMGTPERFYAAALFQKQSPPGKRETADDTNLLLYSLYQQATIGPNTTPEPWSWNNTDTLKWNAWTELGQLSSEDAAEMYVSTVVEDNPQWWKLLTQGYDPKLSRSIAMDCAMLGLTHVHDQLTVTKKQVEDEIRSSGETPALRAELRKVSLAIKNMDEILTNSDMQKQFQAKALARWGLTDPKEEGQPTRLSEKVQDQAIVQPMEKNAQAPKAQGGLMIEGKKSSADDNKTRFEMAQTEFQEQEAEMCRVQFEVKLMQGELEQYTKAVQDGHVPVAAANEGRKVYNTIHATLKKLEAKVETDHRANRRYTRNLMLEAAREIGYPTNACLKEMDTWRALIREKETDTLGSMLMLSEHSYKYDAANQLCKLKCKVDEAVDDVGGVGPIDVNNDADFPLASKAASMPKSSNPEMQRVAEQLSSMAQMMHQQQANLVAKNEDEAVAQLKQMEKQLRRQREGLEDEFYEVHEKVKQGMDMQVLKLKTQMTTMEQKEKKLKKQQEQFDRELMASAKSESLKSTISDRSVLRSKMADMEVFAKCLKTDHERRKANLKREMEGEIASIHLREDAHDEDLLSKAKSRASKVKEVKVVERKFADLESKLNDDFYVEESKLKHELRALETALEEANVEVEETALATSNTGLQMQDNALYRERVEAQLMSQQMAMQLAELIERAPNLEKELSTRKRNKESKLDDFNLEVRQMISALENKETTLDESMRMKMLKLETDLVAVYDEKIDAAEKQLLNYEAEVMAGVDAKKAAADAAIETAIKEAEDELVDMKIHLVELVEEVELKKEMLRNEMLTDGLTIEIEEIEKEISQKEEYLQEWEELLKKKQSEIKAYEEIKDTELDKLYLQKKAAADAAIETAIKEAEDELVDMKTHLVELEEEVEQKKEMLKKEMLTDATMKEIEKEISQKEAYLQEWEELLKKKQSEIKAFEEIKDTELDKFYLRMERDERLMEAELKRVEGIMEQELKLQLNPIYAMSKIRVDITQESEAKIDTLLAEMQKALREATHLSGADLARYAHEVTKVHKVIASGEPGHLLAAANDLQMLFDQILQAKPGEQQKTLDKEYAANPVNPFGSDMADEKNALPEDAWVTIDIDMTQDAAAVPIPRQQHGCALIGSNMYVVGGSYGGRSLRDIQIFNMENMTWTKMGMSASSPESSLPPITGCKCVVNEAMNTIYIVGGFIKGDDSPSMTVFELIPRARVLRRLPTLGIGPTVRAGHSVTMVGSSLFIFGGEEQGGETCSDLHELNLTNRRWHEPGTHGVAPSARSGHCAWGINHSIFILGGANPKVATSADLLCLNTKNMTWSKKVAAGKAPNGRQHAATCVLGKTTTSMIMAGGLQVPQNALMHDVCVLSLSIGYSLRWGSVEAKDMPQFGEGASMVVVEDRDQKATYLVVYGGYTGKYDKNVHVTRVGRDYFLEDSNKPNLGSRKMSNETSEVSSNIQNEMFTISNQSQLIQNVSVGAKELMEQIQKADIDGLGSVDPNTSKKISSQEAATTCADHVRTVAIEAARSAAREAAKKAQGPGQAAAISVSAAVDAAAQASGKFVHTVLWMNDMRFAILNDELSKRNDNMKSESNQIQTLTEEKKIMEKEHLAALERYKRQLVEEKSAHEMEMLKHSEAQKKVGQLEGQVLMMQEENIRMQNTALVMTNQQVQELTLLKLENQKLKEALAGMNALENKVKDLMSEQERDIRNVRLMIGSSSASRFKLSGNDDEEETKPKHSRFNF